MNSRQLAMDTRKLAVKVLPAPVKLGILHRRKHALDAVIKYRELTGGLGSFPDFLVIGGQKCGTTYLYDRLQEHPDVRSALAKEIDFFQVKYDKGPDWYRGHFRAAHQNGAGELEAHPITGEASGYISYPEAPARIAAAMPDAKLIALLRNPVERAYSHFHHVRRLGIEQVESFDDALELDRSNDGSRYHFQRRTYLEKGLYAEQLEWWLDAFPSEQMLIFSSEQFYRDPTSVLKDVAAFLELTDWEPAEYTHHKQFSYPKMSDETRARLQEFYRQPNERLFHMLDVDYGWNG